MFAMNRVAQIALALLTAGLIAGCAEPEPMNWEKIPANPVQGPAGAETADKTSPVALDPLTEKGQTQVAFPDTVQPR
jgi:hypothetical protein